MIQKLISSFFYFLLPAFIFILASCENKGCLRPEADSISKADSIYIATQNQCLECNNVACDTVNSYRFIFISSNNQENDSLLNSNDTIQIKSLSGGFRVEGWHCKTCKGTETIKIIDENNWVADSLKVIHIGHTFSSNILMFSHILKNKIYHIEWKNGPAFFIKTY